MKVIEILRKTIRKYKIRKFEYLNTEDKAKYAMYFVLCIVGFTLLYFFIMATYLLYKLFTL